MKTVEPLGDKANPLATTPKRILVAADWHGEEVHARRAIVCAALAGCDGVIQLGDFGIWPGAEGQMFLDEVEEALRETGLWLMFIDGNHEDFWQLYELPVAASGLRPVRPGLFHIPRGTRWTWGDKTWLALGGATSLDKQHRKLGVSWWPEEAVTQEQARMVMDAGPADIMLTHDCPTGVDIPGLNDSFWSPAGLREAIAHRKLMRAIVDVVQPEQLWHGHFHVKYSRRVHFSGKPCVVTGLCDGAGGVDQNVILVGDDFFSEEP